MHVRGHACMCKCVQACTARVQNGIAKGRRCVPRPATEGGTGWGTCAWGGGNTSGVWGRRGGCSPGKPGGGACRQRALLGGVACNGVPAIWGGGGEHSARGALAMEREGACMQCGGVRTVQWRAHSATGVCAQCKAGVQCSGGVRTEQRGCMQCWRAEGGCSAKRRGLEAVWHPGGRGWRFPRSRRAGGKRQPVPPLCDFPPRCTVPRRGSPNPLPRPSPPHVRGHRRQQQQRGLKAGRRGPAGREPPLPPPPGIFFFFFHFIFTLFFPPLPSPSIFPPPLSPLPRRFPTPLSLFPPRCCGRPALPATHAVPGPFLAPRRRPG